jgi:hypothetical protein
LVAWLLLTFLAALYTCAKFHVVLSTVLSITELCILYKTQNFLLLNYFFRFIRSRFDWFKVITFWFRNHFHGKCKHDLMTRPSPKKLVKREKVSRKLLRMNEYVKQKSLFQRYNIIIVRTRTTKRKRTTNTIKI